MNSGWYLARRSTSGNPTSPAKVKDKGVGPLSAARLLELASSGGVDGNKDKTKAQGVADAISGRVTSPMMSFDSVTRLHLFH
jgi:hypothetical protein